MRLRISRRACCLGLSPTHDTQTAGSGSVAALPGRWPRAGRTTARSPDASPEGLAQPFSEAHVDGSAVARWLEQFSGDERHIAAALLAGVDFYGFRRLQDELRALHARLVAELGSEVDLGQVDFSKTYCAKSGDIIAYLYRTANRIRSVEFKNIADLVLDGADKTGRTLVLVDDYVGSGTQVLEFYCRERPELLQSYRQVIVLAVVANPRAVETLRLATSAEHDVIAAATAPFFAAGAEHDEFVADVLAHAPRNLRLVYGTLEQPLTQRLALPGGLDQAEVQAFLRRRATPDHAAFASLCGSTCFFYGCPNNMAEIFWNRRLGGTAPAWTPLFQRVDDISIYRMAQDLPASEHVF